MPQSEKFELQGDQDKAPVLGDFCVMLSQGGPTSAEGFFCLRRTAVTESIRCRTHCSSSAKNILLLAPIIGIEGAARVAGPGGDVFEAGGFKTVTGKDALSGGQQLLPGRFRPLRLPGA